MRQSWLELCLWGALATVVMTTALEGAQMTGITRMSLPFLFGTALTRSRRRAMILGYIAYTSGGLAFSFLYAVALQYLGLATWWFGTIVGFIHGLFLVTVLLPNMPYVHPHMRSDFDGPSPSRKVEPPGPFGRNYGNLTALTTVGGQTLFGLVLGGLLQLSSG